jgi:integrase
VSSRSRREGRGPKGYRRLPSGNFQVRVAGFPPEVVADELAATLRVAELRIAKREGHALPTLAGARFRTLGQAAEGFLAHKLAHGGKHGELTAAGADHWRLATRPWREGPLRNRPLRTLTLQELQTAVDARTVKHRVSARNEAQALLAVLRHAQGGDVLFAASLLMVEVPKKTKRTRRDLTPAEFDFLLGFVDARQRRMLALASTLGSRINELFLLQRSWVDLEARRMRIPLEATKEKREKLLDLTDEEVGLLREQLLDVYSRLGTETPFVFPKPHGGQWRYGHFHEDVWAPAKRDAITAWRREHGADPDDETAPTPFDGVTLHTLRRTCVGWLRASQLPVEVIAQRLGHNDGGATLLRHYRYVREGESRSALDRLGAGVRAYLDAVDESGAAGTGEQE